MATFNRQIAFVTGAGSGIGRAISLILARDGARVVAADINKKSAQETIGMLKDPQDHLAVSLDVTSSSSVTESFNHVQKYYGKSPSLLAQAAGIATGGFFIKVDEQEFMDVINVNLKGIFLVQQQMVKCLEGAETNCAIVNLSSLAGKHGAMQFTSYGCSKAAVDAFTKSTARELGKKGIRVNCVVPAFIRTPMTDAIPEKVLQMIIATSALKRIGKPQEIAEIVSFLLSDKSSFVTGAMFEATGGLGI